MSLFLSTTHYFCAAPSGSPLNFMIESVTALAVMLSWQAPELIDQNGEITHYVITYKASGSSDQMEELVMSAPGNDLPADFTYNHMLQGLVQDTQYSVQVAAATTSGTGPSVSLSFNTSGWYILIHFSQFAFTCMHIKLKVFRSLSTCVHIGAEACVYF